MQMTAFLFTLPVLALGQDLPDVGHFKVDTLATGFADAMEMAVMPDGDVLIAERTGALKRYRANDGKTTLVKQFDVSVRTDDRSRETGLLGVTLDPGFAENGWLYVYYSPPEPDEHRLSRFTMEEGGLADERILLRIAQNRENGVCHEGGSLAFGPDGNLFLSTGDNTNPFESNGYAPLDEREGREHFNSQRTAGNTNDLRGKIIRIKPTDEGGYTIPDGNLFPVGTPKTRPEIFAMGCRNPWRIGVDQKSGAVYWGEVGPDANEDSDRGPRGYCEINRAATAGYYGWPYFVADSKPYHHFDFAKGEIGDAFLPAKPLNASRLNTGMEQLPPARDPLWFERRSCYCAGPVFHAALFPAGPGKLPDALDGLLITFDWNNGHFQLTSINDEGGMAWKKDWLKGHRFVHPSDVELGPDGSLYVLEYGSVWYDGTDGKLKRVTYTETGGELVEKELDSRLEGLDPKHPGTLLLGDAICLSCHQTQVRSVGPSYLEVAEKYRNQDGAVATLTDKVLNGGVGVWGQVPMPPNPQFNSEQVSQMVEAILTLEPGGHQR